jgi:predicted MFS family arabinose efflux permease
MLSRMGGPASESAHYPRRSVALLAFAGAATVANLYYSQPLLAAIAAELHVRAGAAAMISTATQLGYAAGLLLLVPLGDAVERRKLLVLMTCSIVAALVLVAVSRTLPLLIVSSALLGFATIVPQLVVPFAAHLAPPAQRGRIIGLVMSGLLIGVILSRSVSGFAAAYIGWRTTYLVAAAVMAGLAVMLRFGLPAEPPEIDLRYGELLRSLGGLIRAEPVLRRHAWIGACGFASFSLFWTSLAFHLQKLSPAYGTQTVGAFGIVGVAGALIAPIAGRLSDRIGVRVLNGTALASMAVAFMVMAISGSSLVLLAIGVILLDAGEQASHISNQARIFALDATLRNRLNAVYMVSFFIGGAAGSLVAGYAWQHSGWVAVCVAGGAFALAGIAPLLFQQRTAEERLPA